MITQNPPPLAQILTGEGKKIIANAIKEKHILISNIPLAIKPEARINGALRVSVASITAFLKDRNIRLLVTLPVISSPILPVSPPRTIQLEEMDFEKPVKKPQQSDGVPAPPQKREAYDGDTAIKIYLREVGQHKLVTPEEEIALAAKIKKGDKKAREQMITANLRLVVKIAHDYEGNGLPLLDLINEGNVGLMKAVVRFDPAKGAKLSTYGSWLIKQSIKRALANQSKTIRLPVHMVDKLSKMRRTAMRLEAEFGREPTDDELGEELGISGAHVASLRTIAIRPASLDAPLGEDDTTSSFGEVIQDEKVHTPYQELEGKTVAHMVQKVLNTLEPREITILRYRFGLDGGDEKTLEEVGEKFGVTRERIRQIQIKALGKMREKIEKIEATKVH